MTVYFGVSQIFQKLCKTLLLFYIHTSFLRFPKSNYNTIIGDNFMLIHLFTIQIYLQRKRKLDDRENNLSYGNLHQVFFYQSS
jgi:hypothetical protein